MTSTVTTRSIANAGSPGRSTSHTTSVTAPAPNATSVRIYAAPSLTAQPQSAAIQFFGTGSAFPGQAYIDSGAHDNAAVIFRTAVTGGSITEQMRITSTGNIGIGKSNPQTKLDVAGDVQVSGNIAAKYQDVAEWVQASAKLPAGTVVSLDVTRKNTVTPSARAYDTHVAGVVSTKPGLSLGEGGDGKVLVATTGRVKVKVDATGHPIKIGDLLVTSQVGKGSKFTLRLPLRSPLIVDPGVTSQEMPILPPEAN